MKMEIRRYGIEIIPQSEQDEAYIETVLGITREHPHALVVRRHVIGIDTALALLEIKRAPPCESGERAPQPSAAPGDEVTR